MDYIYVEVLATTAGLAKINKFSIVVLMEQARAVLTFIFFIYSSNLFLQLSMSAGTYLI